jgi:hypothetical protein
VRAKLQAANDREALRERYRPARVKLLFVGEAPPASGRFFYRANSGLYRAIQSAFIVAFPSIRSDGFLDTFQALGCYLLDLCGKPVDDLEPLKRKRICAEGEIRLATSIQLFQPGTMVTVVRSILLNVERAQNFVGGQDYTSAFHIQGGGGATESYLKKPLCLFCEKNSMTRLRFGLKRWRAVPKPRCKFESESWDCGRVRLDPDITRCWEVAAAWHQVAGKRPSRRTTLRSLDLGCTPESIAEQLHLPS